MLTNDPKPNKNGRSVSTGHQENRKPDTIVLRDGTVIDAEHKFVDKEGRLCVYLSAPCEGIDARINLDDVVVELESDAARDAIGVVNGGDE